MRAEYGAVIAWLFKPSVYPSMLKIVCALRFLGWCRLVIVVLTTTRALFAYVRVLGVLFYVSCVLGLPFLPSIYHGLRLFSIFCSSYQDRPGSTLLMTNHKSVQSSLVTSTPRPQLVRSAATDAETQTYDDRLMRWRRESMPRRRRRSERASKTSQVARSICARLYARCAEVPYLHAIAGEMGVDIPAIESVIEAVESSDFGRADETRIHGLTVELSGETTVVKLQSAGHR